MATVNSTYIPEATFLDALGNPYNPTSVTVTVRSPNGTLTNPAVTNPALGEFESQFTLNRIGVWRFEFTGSGPLGVVVRSIGHVCAEEDLAA